MASTTPWKIRPILIVETKNPTMRVAASIPLLVFAVVIVAKIQVKANHSNTLPEVPAKQAQAFDGADSVRLPQRNIFRAIP